MKHKHIEAAREVRLWIRDIIVPVASVATTTLLIPEVREAIAAKAKKCKYKIAKKSNKEES